MWRDDAYMLDMLIAARKVCTYTEGVSREEFEKNAMIQDAVMRQLEVLGEAARHVSDEAKAEHPEVPWKDLVSLRNRLIHEYFRIKVDRVWDAVANEIPALITLIEPLVPPGR